MSGPAKARDFGIKNTSQSSRYIVFLDADDLYEKTFLECAYWTLETHPEASWTYTDSKNFGARNFLWRKWYDVEWELKENILTVSACIRKKDLEEVEGFGIKEKKVYEDWYLWIKLIKAGKYPIRMSSLLTYYRQKENQSELKESNTKNRKNALKLIKEASRDLVNYRQGIQFPKYDYNFEEIKEKQSFEDEIEYLSTNSQNKINVLMIIPWLITGGADRFNLSLVSKLDKDKFDFTIITTAPATNELREKFEEYATVYDLTTFLEMKDWFSFINYIIKKKNINLLFNSNSIFGYKILPLLKAINPDIPIVDYVHMEEWYWRNGGYSRDSSILQNIIDKTFTCNENSKRVFVNHFNRKEREVQTIYIGVDENKFNPENFDKKEVLKEIDNNYRIERAIKSGKKVISYICRIADQKRPYLFFEVIKKLAKKRKDFIVLVAGDGPMLDELKQKISKEKLKDFFVFLGVFNNTEKIYKISDVTVNTSIKEGLALTSYESLAMGVPVVSSNVGGQAELINHNVGIIVPCMQKEKEILNFDYSEEEVNNYAYAISEILDNTQFYKQNCREKILNGFNINTMIKEMEKQFIQISNNPNKEKKQHGEELSKNKEILKEIITLYFDSCKQEYEWQVNEFNKKNIHQMNFSTKKQFYEHTLEYKLKHPIVVVLKKFGIYEDLKRLIYKFS